LVEEEDKLEEELEEELEEGSSKISIIASS
jgi:hypothetical protein